MPTVVLMTKARRRVAGIFELGFQQVVDDIDRAAEIAEEVMDPATRRHRHRVGVEARRRQGGVAVEPLVEVEKETVHRLQRIVRGGAASGLSAGAAGGQKAERAHQNQFFQIHCPTWHRPDLPPGAPSPHYS